MKNLSKITLLTMLGAVIAALVYFEHSASSETTRYPPRKKRLIKAEKVRLADNTRAIRFAGITRAVNRAKLAFTIGERLVSRPVEVGDHVEAGATLATLDNRKLSNEVETLKLALVEVGARISQIERDHKRYRILVESSASPRAQLEKILENEAVLLASRATRAVRLREAERMLKETVLRAPFSGTVTEVLLEPGEFARPGSPVVVLSGDGQVEIEVEVPESIISRLSAGMRVTVDLPLVRRTGLKGVVRYLGRTALGSGRLFPVLVALDPGEQTAAGMSAEVVFSIDGRRELSVPISAVINPGGHDPQLFRVNDTRVEKVCIEVGEILGSSVSVRGPLHIDDLVVVAGHTALLDGDAVEVTR